MEASADRFGMVQTRRRARRDGNGSVFQFMTLSCDEQTIITNKFVSDHEEGMKGNIRQLGVLRLLDKGWAKAMRRPLLCATLKVMMEKRKEWRQSLTNPMFKLHVAYSARADTMNAAVFLAFMENSRSANGFPALKLMARANKLEEEEAERFAASIPHIPPEHLPMLNAIVGNLEPGGLEE